MRPFDLSPLFRATVGFDRLVDRLTENAAPAWPPYNIERLSDDQYRITAALAGFRQDQIEITQQGNVLIIAGEGTTASNGGEMLHRGLAAGSFRLTFNLADHVIVREALLENGLLTVELIREVPEKLKPQRIAIRGPRSRDRAQPTDVDRELSEAA